MVTNRFLLVLALLGAVVGCDSLGRSRTAGPGPASYQRTLAEQFDPYPENEPAPPIVGSRPRDYQKPTPETPRVQWSPWPWKR